MNKDFRGALFSFFPLFLLTACLTPSISLLLWLFESLSTTWPWIMFVEPKDLLFRYYRGAVLLERMDGAVVRPESG